MKKNEKPASSDVEAAVEKYLEYKAKSQELDSKLNKYKQSIKQYMKKNKITNFSTPIATIQLQNATKSTISKKGTPLEIWNQYCKESQYEILNVKKNKT